MRNGNGVELVKKIRENDFETMIIMLQLIQRRVFNGFNKFKCKSLYFETFKSKKLSQALEKYLLKSSKPIVFKLMNYFDLQKRIDL